MSCPTPPNMLLAKPSGSITVAFALNLPIIERLLQHVDTSSAFYYLCMYLDQKGQHVLDAPSRNSAIRCVTFPAHGYRQSFAGEIKSPKLSPTHKTASLPPSLRPSAPPPLPSLPRRVCYKPTHPDEQVVVLGLCILSAYLIRRNRFYYLPESAAAILVGVVVGGMAKIFYPTKDELDFLSFNSVR